MSRPFRSLLAAGCPYNSDEPALLQVCSHATMLIRLVLKKKEVGMTWALSPPLFKIQVAQPPLNLKTAKTAFPVSK